LNGDIEASALAKRYGSTWALRDCSVRIPGGRVVALVGPNGAGKTTFLRLSAGLDEPSAGHIQVLGWSPQAQPTLVLPRIGFVAQDRPLYGLKDGKSRSRSRSRGWPEARRPDWPGPRGVPRISLRCTSLVLSCGRSGPMPRDRL